MSDTFNKGDFVQIKSGYEHINKKLIKSKQHLVIVEVIKLPVQYYIALILSGDNIGETMKCTNLVITKDLRKPKKTMLQELIKWKLLN